MSASSYLVLTRRGGGEVEFVRDGFGWLPFLLPPVWFGVWRMWREAGVALAAWIAVALLAVPAGQGLIAAALVVAMHLFAGMEAAALRIAAMRRRGWSEWGAIDAASAGDAELRYLDEAGPDVAGPSVAPVAETNAGATLPPRGAPALGLLSYPGAR